MNDDAEQLRGELARAKHLLREVRSHFGRRHLTPLEARLARLDRRIQDAAARGIMPTYQLAEAAALRHALAMMRAALALTDTPIAGAAPQEATASAGVVE